MTGVPARVGVLHPAVAALTVVVGSARETTVEVGPALGTSGAAAAITVAVRIVAGMIAAVPGPARKAVMGVAPVVTGSQRGLASAMTGVGAGSRPRVRVCPNPVSRKR